MSPITESKNNPNDKPLICGEALLSRVKKLGLLNPDNLVESHQLDRLKEVFDHLQPALQRDLQTTIDRQLDRKHARIKAFAEYYELTAAELDLLTNLCAGLNTAEHAEKRNISKHTVRTHMQRLREKTGAKRQAEVIWMALESKPINPR